MEVGDPALKLRGARRATDEGPSIMPNVRRVLPWLTSQIAAAVEHRFSSACLQHAARLRTSLPAPAIFLGYGTSDRLSRADSLLAAALPASHVFLTTGGHEWPAWRRVLGSFLQSPEFATHCR